MNRLKKLNGLNRLNRLTEGRKMFWSVMVVFAVYVIINFAFEDFDRMVLEPFDEINALHQILFSIVIMCVLAVLLHRYSRRMDERISREQADKENQMRRQLTQNIAHELKTPVASILGYTDTILEHPEMDEEMRTQFLERTQSQAQRLTSLLQDLSTLNRMDYAADNITMDRVDVTHIVKDIILETSLAASHKAIKVKNNLPGNITVNGNASLIYSIFRNLMDNAINYAGNDTVITIDATEEAHLWRFTFADNGVGIPDEHLSRIFERFYRIDKGRSRSLGGTGLGLAIVKNAVQLHGGTIKAQSADKGGLRFDFSLKE